MKLNYILASLLIGMPLYTSIYAQDVRGNTNSNIAVEWFSEKNNTGYRSTPTPVSQAEPVRYSNEGQQYAAPIRYAEPQNVSGYRSAPAPVNYAEPAHYASEGQQYAAPIRYAEPQNVSGYRSAPAPVNYTEPAHYPSEGQQYAAPIRYAEPQNVSGYRNAPAPVNYAEPSSYTESIYYATPMNYGGPQSSALSRENSTINNNEFLKNASDQFNYSYKKAIDDRSVRLANNPNIIRFPEGFTMSLPQNKYNITKENGIYTFRYKNVPDQTANFDIYVTDFNLQESLPDNGHFCVAKNENLGLYAIYTVNKETDKRNIIGFRLFYTLPITESKYITARSILFKNYEDSKKYVDEIVNLHQDNRLYTSR